MLSGEQERVFARWVEEHPGVLFKVIRSHEANPEDQQDLLQEMLLQLWRSVPAYAGKCKETTWIYRVALNTAYAWCRAEKKRRERHETTAAFTMAVGALAGPLETAETRSDLEFVYSAIRKLSKSDASLIIMHLDGFSAKEISEVIGITENNAAVKLSRARKQLAELVKEELR